MPELKAIGDELAVTSWKDFIGQETMKERLQVHAKAALNDGRPLEHILLQGPPGSGKSNLARLIASLLDEGKGEGPEPITTLMLPSMSNKALMAALLDFQWGVLFLDELHALNRAGQEMLLSLLAHGYVQDARGRQYNLPWVTVIAATTERDKIIGPLYDRFQIIPEFEPYSDEELGKIVKGMAKKVGLRLDEKIAIALGRAAGGIPRNAERLVMAARGLDSIGKPVTAEAVLDLCAVEHDGLTALHLRYLNVLLDQGGIAGQKTIEMSLRIPASTVREIERLLVERTYLDYTPGGRQLTPEGRRRVRGETRPTRARSHDAA